MSEFGELALASALFVTTHFALSSRVLRVPLIRMISSLGFMGLYSAISATLLIWMINAYVAAPVEAIWASGTTFSRYLALLVMPLATVLLVGGYTVKNPTAIFLDNLAKDDRSQGLELPGVIRISRHPVMWAVSLWAFVHIIAQGHIAAILFFGSLIVLALGGAWHIDQKKIMIWGDNWRDVMDKTSNAPFIAIFQGRTRVSLADVGWWRLGLGLALYGVFILLHGPVIGVSLIPEG